MSASVLVSLTAMSNSVRVLRAEFNCVEEERLVSSDDEGGLDGGCCCVCSGGLFRLRLNWGVGVVALEVAGGAGGDLGLGW